MTADEPQLEPDVETPRRAPSTGRPTAGIDLDGLERPPVPDVPVQLSTEINMQRQSRRIE